MAPDARFSHRLDWGRTENDLAVAGSARRLAGDPILDLTETNPLAVGLLGSAEADAVAHALGRAAIAPYAPAARGTAAARRAIADSYAAAGTPIDPDRVVLTSSSSESFSYLWKLLCDPGDAVLIPEPSYPLFDYLAHLDGVATCSYRLTHDSTRTGTWSLDMNSVDQARATVARSATKVGALVVVSPNNPTGSVLRADDLAQLDDRAAADGIALVADEVFSHTVHRPSATIVSCVAAQPTQSLSFTLGGLSKSCGLPQLKLGWIAVGGPPRVVEEALARLELIADTYLSVGAPVQAALPDLLRIGTTIRASIAARVLGNSRHLAEIVGRDSPLTILPSEAGWSAIVRLPATHTDEDWALTLLQKDGVLAHPGYFFDLRGGTFVVLSLLPAPEVFREAVQRLVARVSITA
jgi:alanine-synthesizing transaminase